MALMLASSSIAGAIEDQLTIVTYGMCLNSLFPWVSGLVGHCQTCAAGVWSTMQCSDEGYGQWQETMVAWARPRGMHLVHLNDIKRMCDSGALQQSK